MAPTLRHPLLGGTSAPVNYCAIGTSRLRAEPQSEHGSNWLLMADPEANEFSACDAGQDSGGV